MYKQVWTPFELIRQNGRRITGCFTVNDKKIPIIWGFVQKNIPKPNDNCFKTWHNFLEWLVNERVEERHRFDKKIQ